MQLTYAPAVARGLSCKVAILLILHTALYFQVWKQLFSAWENKPQTSHGYLVIPLCVWLCSIVRKKNVVATYEPSYSGMFIVIAGLILFLLASVSEVTTLANISYMISLAGLIVAAFGFSTLKTYLFPYLFLFFMFPIPDILYLGMTSPLKLLASNLSFMLISMLGYSVYREGNVLQLPHFQMEVVEACSGMQYFISFIMLAVLFAFFLKSSCWKKLVFIFSAIPISILTNIIRISGMGILGELYGEEAIDGVYHSLLGVAIFAIGLLVFYSLYSLLAGHKSDL